MLRSAEACLAFVPAVLDRQRTGSAGVGNGQADLFVGLCQERRVREGNHQCIWFPVRLPGSRSVAVTS